MSTFASRLKELRNEKNWSQRDLSLHIDVIQQTIASWERGKGSPDDTTKIRLADLFGVSLDYLLGRTPDKYSQAVSELGELNEYQKEILRLNRDFLSQHPPKVQAKILEMFKLGLDIQELEKKERKSK